MAGYASLVSSLFLLLIASSVQLVAAQQCQSASVQQFVQLRENVTREVIEDLKDVVRDSVPGVVIPPDSPANEEVLYDALTTTLGLPQSNASRNTFSNALTSITDAYFEACFGPEDERPTVADAQQLIVETATDLQLFIATRNQTLLQIIRRTFGRFTCLLDGFTGALPTLPPGSPPANCASPSTLTLANYKDCLTADTIQPIFGLGPLVDVQGQQVESRRCVGFVVDDTGSMSEEIVAVRNLIKSFINAEMDLPACYVLVSFNDYGSSSPIGNLGVNRVYDPKIADSTTETPTITRTGGGAIYGSNQLNSDVDALTANGGGDCPEYAMIGMLEAINNIQSVEGLIVPAQGNLHHVIVLTDASAKDNYLYTNVIAAAAANRVTVHYFYSGGGCGGSFGNLDDIRVASGGISVNNFADFDAFGTFIQLYNQAVAAANSASGKRKRQSSTGNIFSEYAQCHDFEISLFSSNLAVLARTTQSSVVVTRPDSSTHTITIPSGGQLGLHQEENPIPGQWRVCVPSGTMQVSVTAPVQIEIDLQFTKKTDAGIIPTAQVPRACDTGTIIVTTPQHHLIALNQSVYLDFVREDNTIAASSELTECNGVFTGDIKFPGDMIFYQLRGHDIKLNQFAHVIANSEIRFTPTKWSPNLATFNPMPVNPGVSSFHKFWLTYNETEGPLLAPTISGTAGGGVTANGFMTQGVWPEERSIGLMEVHAPSSLSPGSTFPVTVVVGDNCTDVAAKKTFVARVYTAISFQTINTTIRGQRYITIFWQDSIVNADRYVLYIDYDNGTVQIFNLTLSRQSFVTEALQPYQRIFVALQVLDSSDNILAFGSCKRFRSQEGESGPVDNVRVTPISNTSARVWFDPPSSPNGVITGYRVRVQKYSLPVDIFQRNYSASEIRQFQVDGLAPYQRYRAYIVAENAVGDGKERDFHFYSRQGTPVSPATNLRVRGLNRTSINITWDPPSIPDRRGIISMYTVKVSYNDENGNKVERMFNTDEPTLNVTDLPELPLIQVTVTTSTEAGAGPISTVLTVPVELPPSAPRQLTLTGSGLSTVALSWQPPEFTNGVITEYKIVYRNGNGDMEGEKIVPNTFQEDQTVSTTIGDLNTYDNHYFMVAAATSAGYGPFSDELPFELARHSAIVIGVVVAIVVMVCLLVVMVFIFGVIVLVQRLKKSQQTKQAVYSPEGDDDKAMMMDKLEK